MAGGGPRTLTPQELERRSRQWKTAYGRRLLDAIHELDLKKPEVAEDYRFLETLAFEPRTSLDALLAIQVAGRLGLPAPPWAAERFDQIVEDRIRGQCQSLDEAFGFSARGRGEHKRAAVYKRLLAERDERLALSVHRLRVCGLTLDEAVRRAALKEGHREAEDPRGYRLELIRARRHEDPASRELRLEQNVRAIYYAWRGRHRDVILDTKLREKILLNKSRILASFPPPDSPKIGPSPVVRTVKNQS